MVRPWERVETRLRGDYKVFRVREDRARSPRTGKPHRFYVVESADWVNCLPVTDDGELICVRQYRHGTQSAALEIPGGLIDKGELPEVAARREMLEETGYVARDLVHLGSMRPNPAIQNNTCHYFLARGATLVSRQHLDQAEDIEVVPVPVAALLRMVAEGEFWHGITLAGLFYLDLYMRGIRTKGQVLGTGAE